MPMVNGLDNVEQSKHHVLKQNKRRTEYMRRL